MSRVVRKTKTREKNRVSSQYGVADPDPADLDIKQTRNKKYQAKPPQSVGGSLAVVRSYAPGCEPLVTGNLAMGLTIRSSHKQELSSVYQFIDVLYSLCIYEALQHLSLSCLLLLLQFHVLSACSPCALHTVLVQGYIY